MAQRFVVECAVDTARRQASPSGMVRSFRLLQRAFVMFGALGALGTLGTAPVSACGYEDPASIALGALNFSYPDALHVGTAVWQAEQAGVLPRQAYAAPTAADPATLARAAQAALWDAMRLMERLRARLADQGADSALAVVLVPTVFWSRIAREGNRLTLVTHAPGPAEGDVVMVTDARALTAWLDARLSAEQMLALGLARLYGDAGAVQRMRSQLANQAGVVRQ